MSVSALGARRARKLLGGWFHWFVAVVLILMPGGLAPTDAEEASPPTVINVNTLPLPESVAGTHLEVFKVTRDGRFVLYSSGGNAGAGVVLHRFDRTNGEDLLIGSNQYTKPVMSQDGRYVAFTRSGNLLTLWDGNDRSLTVLGEGSYPSMSGDGRFVSWFRGGLYSAVYDRQAQAFVPGWEYGCGEPPYLTEDGSAFILNGVCRQTDRGLSKFSTTTGTLLSRSSDPKLGPTAISSDGRYVVGIAGGTVDEMGVGRFDFDTGQYQVIPRTGTGWCSSSIAVDDTGVVFFSAYGSYKYGGVIEGPLADGQFDQQLFYRADFADGGLPVSSSMTGQIGPQGAVPLECQSVAATGDGSLVLWGPTRSTIRVESGSVSGSQLTDVPPPPDGTAVLSTVGMVSYTVSSVLPSGSLWVDFWVPSTDGIVGYAKYENATSCSPYDPPSCVPTDGGWTFMPPERVEVVSSDHVRVQLTDGGIGDEDKAVNGFIVDPGAWLVYSGPSKFVGFYQPVDMGEDVWNTVKGGSTVPLKFEVFAGPTELTDTAVVDSFTVEGVGCPVTGFVADDIVTTTGDTSLRYDATVGQFIQNWQTPKKSGVCYKVTMTTDDGASISAKFKLK